MLYVDIPSRAEIEQLVSIRAEPAVSIYLKTTPLTQEIGASRIALKNLLKEGLAQLRDAETLKRKIWPIETAISDLIDDQGFWTNQAHSLAILATSEVLRTYRLANRIDDQIYVSDRFHLQPLLRAITFPHNAFVLVLAEGGVRFYEVTAEFDAVEIRVPDMPKDAGDALGKTTLNDRSPSGRFQGSEGQNLRLRQYVRIVDQALRNVVKGRERPLIIAAADPLASMFRQVSTYHNIAPGEIKGNAELMNAAQLAAGAREILDHIYAGTVQDLKLQFEQRKSDGRAISDVGQTARAATFGAIDTLLFDMDADMPGQVGEDGSVHPSDQTGAGNYGIVDEIAGRALISGARVVAVRKADLPADGVLAAILRYPV